MIDRGQLELAQMTERLLASRHRPKRQWLIQRIGQIWWGAKEHHSCFRSHLEIHRAHTKPTQQSMDAVASFSQDPNINVKIAVAAAMGTSTVPDEEGVRALAQLLRDEHPVVRINAARWLSSSKIEMLDGAALHQALTNDTYSVRWIVAELLHATQQADRGWKVLRNSMPRTDPALYSWMQHCLPYGDRFATDAELAETVSQRLSRIDDSESWKEETLNTFRLLSGRARDDARPR